MLPRIRFYAYEQIYLNKTKKYYSFQRMDSKPTPLIIENSDFLKKLAKTKSRRKTHHLLKSASSQQLLSLVEIALNIVRSRFKLTTRQKKRLLPHASFVRHISRVRSERGARKLFYQKGNGLPIGLFASLLTPVLIDLARSALKGGENSN